MAQTKREKLEELEEELNDTYEHFVFAGHELQKSLAEYFWALVEEIVSLGKGISLDYEGILVPAGKSEDGRNRYKRIPYYEVVPRREGMEWPNYNHPVTLDNWGWVGYEYPDDKI